MADCCPKPRSPSLDPGVDVAASMLRIVGRPAPMPLAKSAKGQGSGDSVPGRWALHDPKVRENRMSREKRAWFNLARARVTLVRATILICML